MAGGGGFKKSREGAAKLDALGEDYIFGLRAEGMTTREIYAATGSTAQIFYWWLGKKVEGKRKAEEEDGTCRRERWEAASRIGAETLGEGSGKYFSQLYDPAGGRAVAGVTREEIALAKAAADHDKWVAGSLDPHRYRGDSVKGLGEGNQSSQVVNIGQLHLHALKAPPPPRPAALQAAPDASEKVVEGEFEVVAGEWEEVDVTPPG